MRNTSANYKKQIQGARTFCTKIIISYADGSSQTLTELQDFKQLKFVDECSGSSDFEIGAAVVGEALITLNNRTGKFNGKNFYGAHITAYAGILVDEKPELLKMGQYIVDEPVSPGISIALTAYDNLILTDKVYVPGITYPATLAQIADDACTQCGVVLDSLDFPRADYLADTAPDECTCRELLAAVAQLSGCFVRATASGRIRIGWYSDQVKNTVRTLYSKSVCTDDVTITGITITVGDSEAKSGEDGYRLTVTDNLLLEAGNEQDTADYLGGRLIGLQFRPLSVTCQSDPSIEAGDRITVVDEKGNEYQTVVTSTTFAILEAQKVACNAASPTVNAGQRLSETAKAVIASRKYTKEAVEHERTARETALAELAERLQNGSGLYCTQKEQEDGSAIYYMHDKPRLEDSGIVWKMTAEAIGISTDGGETYPYGLEVSGTAILERIYTIGLDAGHITSGTFTAKDEDEKTIFQVNVDTGEVKIDASCITTHSESLDEHLDGLQTAIDKSYTDATQTATALITEAVKEYVKTSDLETLREEIRTQFIQSSDSFEMTFNKLVERITELQDDTSSELSEIKKYIRFKDGNIILGQEENPLILTLQNNRISFSSGGQEVAYFSDDRLYVDNVTIKKNAEIAGLKIKRESGHIYIDW